MSHVSNKWVDDTKSRRAVISDWHRLTGGQRTNVLRRVMGIICNAKTNVFGQCSNVINLTNFRLVGGVNGFNTTAFGRLLGIANDVLTHHGVKVEAFKTRGDSTY